MEQCLVQGLGHGVGHLHERGDAASHGRPGFCGDFRFVGEAWFAEMHLVVDQAGKQVQPRTIVHLGLACCSGNGRIRMLGKVFAYGLDAVAIGEKVAGFDAAFVHEGGASEEVVHEGSVASAGRMSKRRICNTPRKASLKMLRLILEVPNSRSTKVMGTSAMEKPNRLALYFISIWKA